MKKKLLIVFLVLLFAGGVATGVALYQLNRAYGWTAAELVHHDVLADERTRLRVAVDTSRLAEALVPYLPENPALPPWLPWNLPEILPHVVPREVAVLGGSDFSEGNYDLTVFVNEQRGGPALPEIINTRTQFRRSFPDITWEEPAFTLNRRGVLTAKGHLELPLGTEALILKRWSPDAPTDRLALTGGHLAEGVVDNRNGEIVALIAACAPMAGTTLEQLLKTMEFPAVMELLIHVLDARVAVDFKDINSLLIQIRLNVEEEIGGQLEFFVPIKMPDLARQIQRQYGLVMESEYEWNQSEHVYIVDVTLIGVEEKLKAYLRRVIPSAPLPGPPETASP